MTMTIFQALYFMLPAYLANMAPVLVKNLPFGSFLKGNFPLDHEKYFGGQRIFGEHKTYRGFASGVLAGIFCIFLQKMFFPFLSKISLLPYNTFSVSKIILLGTAFGAGALFGDLIKSFFKRRLGISSGKPWFPFDQLDFVIGALLLVQIFYTLPIPHLLIIIIITPVFHFFTNVIAYFLDFKKVWW